MSAFHGADRARTDYIQLAKLALSLLSYSPVNSTIKNMGLSGFEPPTSRLSGVRSNQLSYRPMTNVRPVVRPFKIEKQCDDLHGE